jgi:glyoxylase-like metal-dependent hydrolase (beta-lactamase superfamily II)
MEPFARMAAPDRLLDDGDLADLPGWHLRALHTPGHTPGHLCFSEERTGLLFSGDHVLPRISPNISTTADGLPDPLRSYLASLTAIRELAPTEVLPAHEWRFDGLASRVDELKAHHEHRLDELLRALREHPNTTPWQLAAHLTWSRPWSAYQQRMRIFAVTETDAHLRLLGSRGLAAADDGPVPTWTATAR